MKYFTQVGKLLREFRFERRAGELFALDGAGNAQRVDVSMVGDGTAFSLILEGRSYDVLVEQQDGAMLVMLQGERVRVVVEDERERVAHAVQSTKAPGKREVRAVMPGIVAGIHVSEGDAVQDGQTLLVLEAMKMQNPVLADGAGRVIKLHTRQGMAVASGALLIELDL